MDEAHFAPHAVIDLRDRPNDFNTPALRSAYYDFLFEEDATMDTERLARIERRIARVERIAGGHGIDIDGQRLRGEDALESLDSRWISLALSLDRLNAALLRHVAEGHGGIRHSALEKK